ncbi:esterase lipase thioesterase family protein [Moniliophthora roreri MCA 2997]|uniref:Esterase lipase thioesterase family protein n=2 Tax=Moniliophthora roreri TaxID=221103 RepID=V2WQ44_MONRO|nr:esterase lipase thioesterase family protein [Moniliophthora roreri MCA 2997]KAI3598073.1 esterase lipase thioesterase family protein [Moniliophthora roreri]
MDQVAQLTIRVLPDCVIPTVKIFAPLLEKIREQITSTPRRTFKYGQTDRHQMDVYYPQSTTASIKAPIIFFVYGGGFATGSRNLPAPIDLAYANLASYFAQKGFITIIPDYRLLPGVTFPDPAQDVLDAILFTHKRPQIVRHDGVEGNLDSIFLMGHSAGAVNVTTILLHQDMASSISKVRVKGAVLMSGPYDHNPEETPTSSPAVVEFFGGLDKMKKNCPLGLLKAYPTDKLEALPKILMVEGENEPESFKVVGGTFHEALEELTQQKARRIVADRHNHISLTHALRTGEGEEWAQEAADWMKANV